MHVLCVYVLRPLSGLAFFGEDRLVTLISAMQMSARECTASSLLPDTRTVNLALVQCERHTGK